MDSWWPAGATTEWSGCGRRVAAGSCSPCRGIAGRSGAWRSVQINSWWPAAAGMGRPGFGRRAAGSSWQACRVTEAASGRLIATLAGHSGLIRAVALTLDGRLLASGSTDGTLRFWDVSSNTLLRTLRGDRRYERMDISGLTGVTQAQREAMLALGALDGRSAP